MLLASFCVLLFAPYFPEIVEAHSAAKSIFGIIDSKPTTGDHETGLKPVSECVLQKTLFKSKFKQILTSFESKL